MRGMLRLVLSGITKSGACRIESRAEWGRGYSQVRGLRFPVRGWVLETRLTLLAGSACQWGLMFASVHPLVTIVSVQRERPCTSMTHLSARNQGRIQRVPPE